MMKEKDTKESGTKERDTRERGSKGRGTEEGDVKERDVKELGKELDEAMGAAKGVPIYRGRSRKKPSEAAEPEASALSAESAASSAALGAAALRPEVGKAGEGAERAKKKAEERANENAEERKNGKAEKRAEKETGKSVEESAGEKAEESAGDKTEESASDKAEESRKESAEENAKKGPGENTGKSAEEKKEESAKESTGESAEESVGESGRKRRFPARFLAAGAGLLLLAGVGYYAQGVLRYQDHFLPDTVINGEDVSGLSLPQAEQKLLETLDSYTLTIRERGDGTEEIRGAEIGLSYRFGDSMLSLLRSQNPFLWFLHRGEKISGYEIETDVTWQEELLAAQIDGLAAMDPASWQEPENARISDFNIETGLYEIIPAWPGTEVVPENVRQAVENAVAGLEAEVDLEAEGCYTRSAITETDETLAAVAAELNRYAGAVVTYTFGAQTEILDGSRIHEWLSVDGTTVSLSEEMAAAYVKELAEKYNTAGQEVRFLTSYQEEVTIPGGSYGFKIDEKKELETLLAEIRAGESVEREPEYSVRGVSYGEQGYGDTYVEVNLTTQHLFFYKDGVLVTESDFVSGNEAKGMSTPAGAYYLVGKSRNAVLVGANYRTPVSYWMPFNGGIGLHDAKWRGSFGGTIYKRNGSHGCVNLPAKAAKAIYESISVGDPVFCYQLSPSHPAVTVRPTEGTAAAQETAAQETGTAETTAPAAKPTAAKPAGTAAAQTAAPAPAQTAGAQESASAETDSSVIPTETPAASAEGTPVGPSVQTGAENPAAKNPAGESVPASTEGTGAEGSDAGESQVGPSVPEQTTESITAGGDEESFGPGFTEAAPAGSAETEAPEIGPGMP